LSWHHPRFEPKKTAPTQRTPENAEQKKKMEQKNGQEKMDETGRQLLKKGIIPGNEMRPGVRRYSICGHVFDIPRRYTPTKWLGQGSFGIVWCLCAAFFLVSLLLAPLFSPAVS